MTGPLAAAVFREVRERVVELVRFMFRTRADRWEESLKGGLMIPLLKKGDRSLEDIPRSYPQS